ncbi:hypothetical protein HH212_21300 [Massilia forsythiae]|uniref:Uncharacterized protein n=1 Tax=Massilia forsythiae TaxID=2728020 RepID=A0A7Z2ZUB2_9BURK|nr:hypothetical protein [Massilia forsythiae]QJE02244.1 hypothetical protein HH212_21300 [Massilia forsythiae]
MGSSDVERAWAAPSCSRFLPVYRWTGMQVSGSQALPQKSAAGRSFADARTRPATPGMRGTEDYISTNVIAYNLLTV